MTRELAAKVFAVASTLEEAEDLFDLFDRAKHDTATQFYLSAAYERRKDQLLKGVSRNAQVRAYPRFREGPRASNEKGLAALRRAEGVPSDGPPSEGPALETPSGGDG